MEGKILGIDLGTNSIGLAVRNTDNGNNIVDQLEYYTSIIFKSGVGNGDKGEFSYAAGERDSAPPADYTNLANTEYGLHYDFS